MIGRWTAHWLKNQGHQINYFSSTTSTNSMAKEAAMQEHSPLVFYVTDEQSAGRGQGNHQWLNTAPGTNLLLTCSLATKTPPQPELCLTLGQKLKLACQQSWPELPWSVKPPNDLFIGDKKVAGILLESVSQGPNHRLLFGLGFNALDFPKDGSFSATSLQEHLSQPLEQSQWEKFLKELLSQTLSDTLLR